jgi:hypothetical protein
MHFRVTALPLAAFAVGCCPAACGSGGDAPPVDAAVSAPVCGDGVAGGAELCDASDLRSEDCLSIGEGFTGGTLACTPGCLEWDTAGCLGPAPTGTVSGALAVGPGIVCDASMVSGDCTGTVYLGVLAENPMANPDQIPIASAILPAVSLSGDATASYEIPDVPVGSWYLSAFMDDDGSAEPTNPGPAAGDPVAFTSQAVPVEADQATWVDLTFSLRMP